MFVAEHAIYKSFVVCYDAGLDWVKCTALQLKSTKNNLEDFCFWVDLSWKFCKSTVQVVIKKACSTTNSDLELLGVSLWFATQHIFSTKKLLHLAASLFDGTAPEAEDTRLAVLSLVTASEDFDATDSSALLAMKFPWETQDIETLLTVICAHKSYYRHLETNEETRATPPWNEVGHMILMMSEDFSCDILSTAWLLFNLGTPQPNPIYNFACWDLILSAQLSNDQICESKLLFVDSGGCQKLTPHN